MSERTLLCYGDSNTYGADAEHGGRFAPDVRWTGVLARELGAGWRVVEEGLGGRTTVFDDPLSPYRNGREYLPPCLDSHAPLDLVVLALGTNDLKARFAAGPSDIAGGVGVLVRLALASRAGPDWAPPRVLVLGLPRLGAAVAGVPGFEGAEAKAAALPAHLEQTASELGVDYLELADVATFGEVDGFHLDPAGHLAVGKAVAQRVRRMF